MFARPPAEETSNAGRRPGQWPSRVIRRGRHSSRRHRSFQPWWRSVRSWRRSPRRWGRRSRWTRSRCSPSGPRPLAPRARVGAAAEGRRSFGAADGWVAVSLPGPDDVELLPAWLGVHEPDEASRRRSTTSRPARRGRRGAGPGRRQHGRGERQHRPCRPAVRHPEDSRVSPAGGRGGRRSVLALGRPSRRPSASTGRRVSSRSRAPVGPMARGTAGLLRSTAAGQASVALDLDDPSGVDTLRCLLSSADVVIEASRPRALRHLGVGGRRGRTRCCVVVDHGLRRGRGWPRPYRVRRRRGRCWRPVGGPPHDPVFCADAIADPLSGLLGTLAVLACLSSGRSAVIDLAMSRVAAWCGRSSPMARTWSGRSPHHGPGVRRDRGSVGSGHGRGRHGRWPGRDPVLVIRRAEVDGAIVDVRCEADRITAVGPGLEGADVEHDAGGGAVIPGCTTTTSTCWHLRPHGPRSTSQS